jgi:hypothetical protein
VAVCVPVCGFAIQTYFTELNPAWPCSSDFSTVQPIKPPVPDFVRLSQSSMTSFVDPDGYDSEEKDTVTPRCA